MSEPVFNRVLLKLSGEVLANEYGFGIDPEKVSYLAKQISEEEKEMITKAAENLSKTKKQKVLKALDAGDFNEEVTKILMSLED